MPRLRLTVRLEQHRPADTRHLVTANHNGTVSFLTSGSYRQCRKAIVSRWGHWPPFAHITRTTDPDKLQRRLCP